jgi:hypothetical protein
MLTSMNEGTNILVKFQSTENKERILKAFQRRKADVTYKIQIQNSFEFFRNQETSKILRKMYLPLKLPNIQISSVKAE